MTTLIASVGSFLLTGRAAFPTKRSPADSSCTPQTSEIWFPVQPGVTVLPAGDEPIVNEAPLPPNAAQVPGNFDPNDPDLCWLFKDILPYSVDPVYPTEQTTQYLSLPYSELISAVARVRISLAVQRLNYALRLDDRVADLVIRSTIAVITRALALEVASYQLLFQGTAVLTYRRTLRARSGGVVLGRPSAGFNYSRAVSGQAGVYALTGSAATLNKTYELFELEVGSFSLTGQDASLRELIKFTTEVGSFELSGQSASLSTGRVVKAETGTFDLSGSNATFAGILERDFELVEIFEDDLLNLIL
jgi:hypothetical protein